MRWNSLLLLGMVALSGCEGESTRFDESALEKPSMPEPTAAESEAALQVEVAAGALWSYDLPVSQNGRLEQALAPTSRDRWINAGLSAGQSMLFSLALDVGDTLHASHAPTTSLGDVDVQVTDPAGVRVAASAHATGWVDQVFYTARAAGNHTVRLYCFATPCGSHFVLGRGNDTGFLTAGEYFNQRSRTQVNRRCTNSAGAWIADGECMCAPSSFAMGLVSRGLRRVADLGAIVTDLFTTNGADGAANRASLMNRLRDVYGIPCREVTRNAYPEIKTALRAGRVVVFRSPAFSGAGHYVHVRGFSGQGTLVVDDPYGAWSRRNVWDPSNTTGAFSTNGVGRSYPWASIWAAGASVVICQ